MFLTAGHLCNLIRYPVHIIWRHFIGRLTNAELTLLAFAAHEESANIINKARVTATRRHILNIRPIIIVKIDLLRCIYDGEPALSSLPLNAALSVLVIAPGVDVTRPGLDEGVGATATNF